jgi:hypothetical protein
MKTLFKDHPAQSPFAMFDLIFSCHSIFNFTGEIVFIYASTEA